MNNPPHKVSPPCGGLKGLAHSFVNWIRIVSPLLNVTRSGLAAAVAITPGSRFFSFTCPV
jgi:hypothetical protein